MSARLTVPDGLELRSGVGRTYRVFNPRWWRLGCWLWWWTLPVRNAWRSWRGRATIATGTVSIGGVEYRAVEVLARG